MRNRVGVLLATVSLVLLASGCFGGPSPTGITAHELHDRIAGATQPLPIDYCFFWIPGSQSPEEWTAERGRHYSSVGPAHGLVRGHLTRLERWPSADHEAVLGLRFLVESVHGTTGVQPGDEAVVAWNLVFQPEHDHEWQDRGVPLTLLSFSDETEVIAAVTGESFGPYLVANDGCEPWVIGDGAGVERWGGGWTLDEAEEDAASALGS